MDLKEIHELIKIINKSNLSELIIEKKDFKITLKSKIKEEASAAQAAIQVQATQAPAQVVAPAPQAAPAAVAQNEAASTKAPAIPDASANGDEGQYISIKSPMIGTFYRSPAPDKDPYIEVGDVVKEGAIVCTIEAMKLFNEIESEITGKIVKVLVDDAAPIEYDQPLFLVDPS